MKTILLTLLVSPFLVTGSYASNMSNVEGMNMQQMMQQMKSMQTCLLQVDESELRQYEADIAKLESELQHLCKEGKRDLAQETAISFGKRAAQSNAIQTIHNCTKNMQKNAFMPTLPDYSDMKNQHVCDELTKF